MNSDKELLELIKKLDNKTREELSEKLTPKKAKCHIHATIENGPDIDIDCDEFMCLSKCGDKLRISGNGEKTPIEQYSYIDDFLITIIRDHPECLMVMLAEIKEELD